MTKRKKKEEVCCKDCKYISFKDMYGLCDNPLSPFFCNRPIRPWDSCDNGEKREENK